MVSNAAITLTDMTAPLNLDTEWKQELFGGLSTLSHIYGCLELSGGREYMSHHIGQMQHNRRSLVKLDYSESRKSWQSIIS